MGFRSRALLTGVATGFLKAQNDRRDKMAQRLQELSDNRALMDRERAKSEYANATKAAAEEKAKWAQAVEARDIDADGNYTKAYHDKQAFALFKDPNIQKAYGGKGFKAFAEEYAQMGPKKMTRMFKDPDVLQANLTKLLDSVDSRQRQELSQPVMTGLDKFLMTGVNAVSSAFGATPKNSQEPVQEQEVTFNPYADVDTTGTPEPYTTPSFTPQATSVEVKTVDKHVDSQGNLHLLKTYEDGTTEIEKTSINEGKPVVHTALSYDEDGTEYIVNMYKDKTSTKTPTGLTKAGKAGNIEIKANDLKNPTEKATLNRIRDGHEATRLVGNIMRDTSVETSALAPRLANQIILGVQEELVGTFGSAEAKAKATTQAMNSAFANDLAYIDSLSSEDKAIGTTERNELATKIAGLKQDKLALAYALVRLNRASGRFNGQELQEQIELLSDGSLAEGASVLKRAQDQVEQSMQFDVQQVAADVISTRMLGEGVATSANEVLGWSGKKPLRDPNDGSYFVRYHSGPYEYAKVTPNGGIVLKPRKIK